MAVHLLLVAAPLALVIGGCAAEPEGPPAASHPSSAADVRYNPVDATLCESMRLDSVLRDAGLTIERPRFNGTPDEPPEGIDEFEYTVASCEFDTASDPRRYLYSADVGVVVTEDANLARDSYGIEVDTVERQMADEVDGAAEWGGITSIDGWWAEGIFAEYQPSRGIVSIAYRVYHANLHMRASFNVSYDPEQLETDAVGAFGRDLAETLVEAAVRQVPCEVVDTAPPSIHCDDQG